MYRDNNYWRLKPSMHIPLRWHGTRDTTSFRRYTRTSKSPIDLINDHAQSHRLGNTVITNYNKIKASIFQSLMSNL